jgi:hypothetical protein
MRKKTGTAKGKGARPGNGRIEQVETARPVDYAALFRQKVQEKRETAPTIEREFDGLMFVVRRMNMAGWLRTGRMPEYFAAIYVGDQETARQKEKKMSPEELDEIVQFQKDVVRESVVLPRVVFEDRPLEANEISFKELSESNTVAIEALVMWQLDGAPDVPVRMKGGETAQISDIKTFREESGPVQGSIAKSGSATWQTEPSPRTL